MSRFLRLRHYNLVLPGVYIYHQNERAFVNCNLYDSVVCYLNHTGVSYTEQDVDEIMALYHRKYQ